MLFSTFQPYSSSYTGTHHAPLRQFALFSFSFIIRVLGFILVVCSSVLSEQLNTTNLTLIEGEYDSAVSNLASKLNKTYTFPEFLSSMVPENGIRTGDLIAEDRLLRYRETGFNWNLDYEVDFSTWDPLAVTTWQDSLTAVTDESIAGVDEALKELLVVSWKDSAKQNNGGVRVTFVVNGTSEDSAPKSYVHVLLVENPVATEEGKGMKFSFLDAQQVGGLVWHGNWLYVGDGSRGIRVFDLNHIWEVDSSEAAGMEYVLPQVNMYQVDNFPRPYKSFTFDFLSLDRNSTPPCLLAGQYHTATATTYLAKWPFEATSGRLQTHESSLGTKLIANATWAYRINVKRTRGMIFAHNRYFIASLNAGQEVGGLSDMGGIFIWRPGTNVPPIANVLPRGVGGISYSPHRDLMWAVGEVDGSGLVGIRAGSYFTDQTTSSPTLTPTPTPTATANGTSDAVPSANPQPDNSRDNQNIAIIAGSVIPGAITIGLLLWLIFRVHRRRHSDDTGLSTSPATGAQSLGATRYSVQDFEKGEIPTLKSELDGGGIHQVDVDIRGSSTEPDAENAGSGALESSVTRARGTYGMRMELGGRSASELPGLTAIGTELPTVERRVEVP